MPTYKSGGSVIKVTAPKEFTDQVRNAEELAIVEARVAKMKMNLSSKEYQQAFEQYKLQQEEHKQRMAQISLLSTKQYQQQQNRQQRTRQENPVEPTTPTHTHNIETESSNVLKHFKLMKRIIAGT